MRFKPWHKRLMWLVLSLAVVAALVAFVLTMMRDHIVFFYTPAQVVQQQPERGKTIRLGGLVVLGSVRSHDDRWEFKVTDYVHVLTVHYQGPLPPLFREGQGVVAQGVMDESGIMQAAQLLARHDENYMPPDLAKKLEQVPALPSQSPSLIEGNE